MSGVSDIIKATIDRDPVAFATALNQEMVSRASRAVDEYKKAIAQGLFFNPPEADAGIEGEEPSEDEGKEEEGDE